MRIYKSIFYGLMFILIAGHILDCNVSLDEGIYINIYVSIDSASFKRK